MTSTPPTDRPQVSLVIPIRNEAGNIGPLIDEIRASLDEAGFSWEILVINDGSTDESIHILRECEQRDPRVKVIGRPNTGIVGALNDGLEVATGDLIARMDADDWCSPRRLAAQVDFLKTHPEHGAIGCWVKRTDPYGSPAGFQEPPTAHDKIDAALLAGDGSALVHGTMMMRSELLTGVGGWNPQHEWVEDLDLSLRLAERCLLSNVPQYLYTYRRRMDSVCAQR